MGGLFSKSSSRDRREEVWRQESRFENRLDQEHADTWGGVTSYNLLDLQQVMNDIIGILIYSFYLSKVLQD